MRRSVSIGGNPNSSNPIKRSLRTSPANPVSLYCGQDSGVIHNQNGGVRMILSAFSNKRWIVSSLLQPPVSSSTIIRQTFRYLSGFVDLEPCFCPLMGERCCPPAKITVLFPNVTLSCANPHPSTLERSEQHKSMTGIPCAANTLTKKCSSRQIA